MSDHESFEAPPVESAFDPDDPSLFVVPPKWPRVVGGISTGIAALNLTCLGCGVVAIAVFIPMGEKQIGQPMPDVMRPGAVGYALMALGTVMVLWLLLAGISTFARKPAGRMLHIGWAAVSILINIGSMIFQFAQRQRIMDWVAQNPDSPWAQQQQQNAVFQWIGLALGILLGFGYPAFCLIWFMLVKNKPGDITGTAGDDAIDDLAA